MALAAADLVCITLTVSCWVRIHFGRRAGRAQQEKAVEWDAAVAHHVRTDVNERRGQCALPDRGGSRQTDILANI